MALRKVVKPALVEVPEERLSPMQQLVLDVLAARARLGEPFWNFPRAVTTTLEALSNYGWIWWEDGKDNGRHRAGLTDAGKKELFGDSSYVSPLEQELLDTVKTLEAWQTISDFKKHS